MITAFGELIRLFVIFLGFAAMWSLWIARRDRGATWERKMKDIWIVHFIFVASAIEGNIELLYRHAFPTAALLAIAFALIWTVRGTFRGTMYTKHKH